jgi:putative redox protein
MNTVEIEYKGGLRTSCKHLQSGETLTTDAPTDNNGKGESFSPTDLLATAYGSCMLTIIGIYCNNNGLSFENANCSIKKNMSSEPRRVGGLDIVLDLRNNNWNEKEQQKVKNAGMICPVAKSVHPDMNMDIKFLF